jgi:hypothetical protein
MKEFSHGWTAGPTKGVVATMTKMLPAVPGVEHETATGLNYWPDSVRLNPRREMDLPRLTVPMFGPVGPAYVEDPMDPAGTAD